MSLTDYQEPSATIPLGSASMTVYAVSLEDFAALRTEYGERCLAVFQNHAPDFTSGDPAKVENALIGVLCSLSSLVGAIIARAAREPEAAPIAKRLPLPVQLAALAEIWRLTSGEGLFPGQQTEQLTAIFNTIAPTDPRTLN
jgi:hypothetical protein